MTRKAPQSESFEFAFDDHNWNLGIGEPFGIDSRREVKAIAATMRR
jgi:hypothetical protein